MTNKMICVVCAMQKELVSLTDILTSKTTENYLGYNFIVGDYCHNKIAICKSGIGKVNAGALMAIMINYYQPDLVINTGIAGGYDQSLKTLDIVVGTSVCYSDIDMTGDTSIDVRYGQLQDMPFLYEANVDLINKIKTLDENLKYGTIITADQFVVDYNKTDQLVKKYFKDLKVLACDMESAAYAQICYQNKVDLLVVRAISDIIGENNVTDYAKYCIEAAAKVSNFVCQIIEKC